MTLVPPPSKSPDLNPVGNIWQYLRDTQRLLEKASGFVFSRSAGYHQCAGGAQEAPKRVVRQA
jgi:hypothetical protein